MIKKGSPILISRQDLLDYVSEEEIAFKYVHGFSKVDKSFKSEFRSSISLCKAIPNGELSL